MKYLPFVYRHLRRNWIRTLSTVFGMAVCIFLFCTLQTVIEAVNWGIQSANSKRLITRHALSLVNNVPLAYKPGIAGVQGVRSVATTTWFGGQLQAKKEEVAKDPSDSSPDFSNFFPNFAVDPEAYLAMYPEYIIPEHQRQAFLQDRQGCVIGREIADRFGWSIGDRFFLESFIPPYRRRDGAFEFTVRAIYDTDPVRHPGTHPGIMIFHYEYLYEGTGRRLGAGTYAIEIDDPKRAAEISKTVDEMYENSMAPTKTETEAAFRAGFVSLAGNLALLLNGIGLAVTFTILLVTANTMSMAVRERRTEIAVLKTLGFPSGLVMGLILGEALLLGVLGGGLGLALSALVIQGLPNVPFLGDAVRQFPNLGLSPLVAGLGLAVALVLGLAAGFVPAFTAYRARITDTLRHA